MYRYMLQLSYDGTNYSGFQIQKDKDTIQMFLEKALSAVTKEEIKIVASGRTDAGVSAICQVCHFDTNSEIVSHKVLSYANSLLPPDIRILSIKETSETFNARFSAKKKTYEYFFYIGMQNALYDRFATFIGYDIAISDMMESTKYFVGEHDFSSFCASNTEVKDKVRIIYDCNILKVDDNIYKLEICGNGFLYNMVRIIMGTIVGVGLKKIKVIDIPKIIDLKDRSHAGKTMPSKGLVLKNVEY